MTKGLNLPPTEAFATVLGDAFRSTFIARKRTSDQVGPDGTVTRKGQPTIYRSDNWKKMMSGLVGFITFPEGYTCSIFSAFKEKVPKSTSALGGQEPEWDEGKHCIVMLIIIYNIIITYCLLRFLL